MSKKLSTIWPAEPHTIAKIVILRSYLNAWFRILGRGKRNQTILYMDGFAGPGRYNNEEDGSPVAALQAAQAAITEMGAGLNAKKIHCAFIEKDPARHAVLQQAIASYQGKPRLGLSGPAGALDLDGIDWVIVGGESGPGARPMHIEWVRSILRACRKSGAAFFFKQWGGVQKHRTGRELRGKTYDEMPVAKLRSTGLQAVA
jgi:hypothetical protein